VIRTLTLRLVPFLFALYVVAYLDRINVGFAALQMQSQLGFSDAVYGLGAGIFFAGYFFFQVPSNLILERVGARRWIALLMVVWGIVSASTALVTSATSFYALRFLLGAAEAGFFPGVILYVKNWFPATARARTVARFVTAAPISGVIGGPLSGALLGLHLRAGLAGWQWMFLVEGIPAVVLGVSALKYLVDRPEEATWLDSEEKTWLYEALRNENAAHEVGTGTSVSRRLDPAMRQNFAGRFAAFHSGAIWMLTIVYFGLTTVMYGMSMWLPTVIKNLATIGNFEIGVLSAIPYFAAAIAMVWVGLHSDRSGDRRWHVALPAFAGAMALFGAAYTHSLAIAVILLSITVMGYFSMMGPFWAMPTILLSSTSAAAGIAFINSLGNLGGFFGPYTIGLVRTWTGTFRGGLLVVAATLMMSGALVLMVKEPQPGAEAGASAES
jgi:MFS transporter, ACS family, tartrate transporter